MNHLDVHNLRNSIRDAYAALAELAHSWKAIGAPGDGIASLGDGLAQTLAAVRDIEVQVDALEQKAKVSS